MKTAWRADSALAVGTNKCASLFIIYSARTAIFFVYHDSINNGNDDYDVDDHDAMIYGGRGPDEMQVEKKVRRRNEFKI